MATPPLQQDTRNGLKSGKLSTASLVFIIIAASAPLTVLAGGAPTNYAVAGLLGVPIGYVVLGIILALFAVGYGRMASQIQSSGAFYVFIARGLGLRQGIAGAILALVAYNLMQIGLYGLFGFSAANALTALAGIELPWWLLGIVGWLIVGSGSEQEFLFPVVTLFTWFTNAAAFGLTFLLAVTSFAVMVWANRYHREYSVFVKTIAPLLAGIGMAAVTALILINFNLMMDTEDFFMIWIMPAIILGSGLIGLIWGEILIRRNTMNSAHITGEVAEIEPEPAAPV